MTGGNRSLEIELEEHKTLVRELTLVTAKQFYPRRYEPSPYAQSSPLPLVDKDKSLPIPHLCGLKRFEKRRDYDGMPLFEKIQRVAFHCFPHTKVNDEVNVHTSKELKVKNFATTVFTTIYKGEGNHLNPEELPHLVLSFHFDQALRSIASKFVTTVPYEASVCLRCLNGVDHEDGEQENITSLKKVMSYYAKILHAYKEQVVELYEPIAKKNPFDALVVAALALKLGHESEKVIVSFKSEAKLLIQKDEKWKQWIAMLIGSIEDLNVQQDLFIYCNELTSEEEQDEEVDMESCMIS